MRNEFLGSKGLGMARSVKARLSGLRGIFKHLAEEHGRTVALLRRLAQSSRFDERLKRFPEIRAELLAHERAEHAVLSPFLCRDEATRAINDAHEREAKELEGLLGRLAIRGTDSPDFSALFQQLVELVERHTQAEERTYFPTAQQVMGEQMARDLVEPYVAKKREEFEQLASG